MRYRRCAVLATAALIGGCGDTTGPGGSDARKTETFRWSGQIGPAGTVEIKNLNGDVRASPSADGTVRVVARKEGERDNPSTVRIDVVETVQGVTICAVYPDVPGLPANECLPGLDGQFSSRGNDVSVTFDVEVPADCPLIARTMVGSVQAIEMRGDVTARAMWGDIRITTSGIADATTMSGNINASIGQPVWDRDLAFTSLHGDVTVRVPTNTDADVWGSTRGGSISSDFQLRIERVGAWRQLTGRLGSGGRNLRLTTDAGDLALRAN